MARLILFALLTAGYALGADAPQQPLPFHHKQHSALGLKCAECHAGNDAGDHMGFPPASKCMDCHKFIAKEKPSIQKLAVFAKAKEPIPWVGVNAVASYVYWSHKDHGDAGFACGKCHGDVAQMDVITKSADVTSMQACMTCHKANKASIGCAFCHEDKN
jgi:Cytochrome c7 and related cytochrome c